MGFSWAASPSCTELETIVLDWLGKMLNLPKQFLPFPEDTKEILNGNTNGTSGNSNDSASSNGYAEHPDGMVFCIHRHFIDPSQGPGNILLLVIFLQDDDVLVDPCIGGGVILGSASECVLVSLLSARTDMLRKLKANHPFVEDGILLSKLVMYTSKLVTSQILAIKKAEPDSFQNHFCRLEGPLMR